MNEVEQVEHEEQRAEPTAEAEVSETVEAVAPETTEEVVSEAAQREPMRERKNTRRKPQQKKQRGRKTAAFKRFISIGWSGAREPVDTMFWAEAESDGEWIVVTEFDKVRTRKEILDRLIALDPKQGPYLIAFDFNFSFPAPFFDLLKETDKISDWRGLIAHVREDLKKNVEDGVRVWVEKLGRYRESKLDESSPTEKRRRTQRFDDWGWNFSKKGLPPHEQRSLAERYRRTDFPLRKVAGPNLMSTIQIGYNRLTRRYEFSGRDSRGRGTLVGLAMLDQLLDARPHDVAIWPMSSPKAVTIVEALPWLYDSGEQLEASDVAKQLASYEDFGWDIPNAAREWAARSPEAQRVLFTLLGIIKTELRADRRHRPLRDYNRAIYDDPQIQLEGWIYGLGYRPPEHHAEASSEEISSTEEALVTEEQPVEAEATVE